MRPLTDSTPKPLLPVGGKPLITWHIERLVDAGIHDIVINHAWLGSQIEKTLGQGEQFGARLHYSPESTALETAGGIAKVLPFFQGQPFLVVNGDIWCDWSFTLAEAYADRLREHDALACLVLVGNPPHHPDGDFVLLEPQGTQGQLRQLAMPSEPNNKAKNNTSLTFAGIGVYRPELFDGIRPNEPTALGPLLRAAIKNHQIVGSHHRGEWIDVGTPERLKLLDRRLARQA